MKVRLFMKIPNTVFYTNQHLWVSRLDDNCWLAGITDYAQDLLGDIVFIEPPDVGTELINGQVCGLVESVKTGSDLHAPMNGIVIEINKDLLDTPELINEKPYSAWIFKFNPNDKESIEHFLDAKAYEALTQS